MVSNNPNRKSLEEVCAYLECKAEGYRVWLALLEAWETVCSGDEAEAPRGSDEWTARLREATMQAVRTPIDPEDAVKTK